MCLLPEHGMIRICQFKVLIRVFDNISKNLMTNVFFRGMLISTHLFSRGPTDEKEKIITHKYRVRDDLCDQGLFFTQGVRLIWQQCKLSNIILHLS